MFVESLAQFIKDKSLSDIFNLDDMDITKDEFIDLVEMIFMLMINTYLKKENEKVSKEESIALFNRRVSFIEFGVKKRGE